MSAYQRVCPAQCLHIEGTVSVEAERLNAFFDLNVQAHKLEATWGWLW